MNKIYSLLLAFATAIMTFTSCSESNDAFFTATENDYPRILNTDIPEGAGGERSALPAISRGNFTFTVIVTPADYTTVTWKIDGAEVSSEYVKNNGKDIEYPLIAGKYDVDIIATTTKGLSTQRLCTLEVLPIEGDPAISADSKNLWCQIGTKKVMDVSNFENVASMTIGGQPISDFKNNGSTVEFTVPTLAVGDQKVIVTATDGTKYGCGNVNVQEDKYVDPGVQTIMLWEGSNPLNWDAENVKVTAEKLADVPVGTDLYIVYEKQPESELAEVYWALRIVGPWWDPDILPQTDFGEIEGDTYVLTYTEERKAIVDQQGSLSLVGNGLRIKSIYYQTGSAGGDTTFWEGNEKIAWNEVAVLDADQVASLKVGQELHISFTILDPIPDGYTQIRMITPGWGFNPEGNELYQFDPSSMGLGAGESGEIVKVVDQDFLDNYASGLSLTGNGCVITKVMAK